MGAHPSRGKESGEASGGLVLALRHGAAAQLARMAASLERRGTQRHSGIHEARKAARRCRAVLALCAKHGDEATARLDRAVRAACKDLSRLRNAHAVVEIAATRSARLVPRATAKPLRSWLRQRRDRLLAAALDGDPDFQRRRRRIQRAAALCATLDWSGVDGGSVRHALRRSSERLRKAARDAQRRPTLALRHRWRRRLRRLRMQVQMLDAVAQDRAWPRPVRVAARRALAWVHRHAPSPAELTAASDALGRDLDRSLLCAALRREAPPQLWRILPPLLCGRGARALRREFEPTPVSPA